MRPRANGAQTGVTSLFMSATGACKCRASPTEDMPGARVGPCAQLGTPTPAPAPAPARTAVPGTHGDTGTGQVKNKRADRAEVSGRVPVSEHPGRPGRFFGGRIIIATGTGRRTVGDEMFRVELGRARIDREALSRHEHVAMGPKPVGPSHQVAKQLVAPVGRAVVGIGSASGPAPGGDEARRERVSGRDGGVDRCKHLRRVRRARDAGRVGRTVWLELKLSRRRIFSVRAHRFRHTRRAALP